MITLLSTVSVVFHVPVEKECLPLDSNEFTLQSIIYDVPLIASHYRKQYVNTTP